MSAASQVWCQLANIQNPKSLQCSSFYSSEGAQQNRAGHEAKVSRQGANDSHERLGLLLHNSSIAANTNDSHERPGFVLQNSNTAANTIELQDRSLATSIPASVPDVIRSDNVFTKRRITLARLVKGVYELEYRRLVGISFEKSPPARSWWESVNFDLVTDEFALDSREGDSSRDGSIDLAVYKWNNSASTATAASNSEALPCRPVVIAIRGTLPSMEDGWHNLHGSFQCLHMTPRFRHILEVVKRAVAAHGSDEICITGHSLGAALGLLVARTLATEERIQIECHLFNPVYAYTWMPTSDELLENEELWRTMRALRCVTVAGLANIFMDDASRIEILSQYEQLHDWTPHIYVNTGDPFCRGYLEYFSSHERLARNGAIGAYFARMAAPFSGRGLLTAVVGSKPLHLVPSAVLHVCEGEPPTWPGTDLSVLTNQSRYSSHNLGSWMAEDLPLHTREVKLSSW